MFLLAFECPIKKLLHIYCPGCGITRATESLLSLNVPLAFYYNPMVLLAPLYIIALVILTVLAKTRLQDRGGYKKKADSLKRAIARRG